MLQTIKVEMPFQKIGVDLLGPFPTSVNGNKMLIVAVDYLTKWVELEALPTGKADVVTQFIVDKIVLRHGAPESIITDRGKCFLAGITQDVWKKLDINHKTTSGYHPQTNGQVERMNHTLAMMISMYITDDQTNWDEQLPFICFAYNTARQESTGFSPFFLLYGREPNLPVDILLGSHPNPVWPLDAVSQPYANKLMDDLKKARAIVRARIEVAQLKQAERYDSVHKDAIFHKNDLVFIYKPIRKKGRSEKLLHRWMGPYIVTRQTTPVNYEVKLQVGKQKSDIAHVGSMKPYTQMNLSTEEIIPEANESATQCENRTVTSS
jgi:hypothetical protein